MVEKSVRSERKLLLSAGDGKRERRPVRAGMAGFLMPLRSVLLSILQAKATYQSLSRSDYRPRRYCFEGRADYINKQQGL